MPALQPLKTRTTAMSQWAKSIVQGIWRWPRHATDNTSLLVGHSNITTLYMVFDVECCPNYCLLVTAIYHSLRYKNVIVDSPMIMSLIRRFVSELVAVNASQCWVGVQSKQTPNRISSDQQLWHRYSCDIDLKTRDKRRGERQEKCLQCYSSRVTLQCHL